MRRHNDPRTSVRASLRWGFTLVELLVVIGIIAVLVAMLLPALSKVRRQANTLQCASNMRQIGMFLQMYCNEHQSYYPCGYKDSAGLVWSWDDLLAQYDGRKNQVGIKYSTTVKYNGVQWWPTGGRMYPRGYFLGRERVYQCPSDRGGDWRIAQANTEWKTYCLNNNFALDSNSKAYLRGISSFWDGGTRIQTGSLSVRQTQVKQPSETMALGEVPNDRNYFGDVGSWAELVSPIYLAGSYNGLPILYPKLHGNYINNFLFCDGHVTSADIRTTCMQSTRSNWDTRSSANLGGMWTVQTGD